MNKYVLSIGILMTTGTLNTVTEVQSVEKCEYFTTRLCSNTYCSV